MPFDQMFNCRRSIVVAVAVLTLGTAAMAQAKFRTLHTFTAGTDGRSPMGQLVEDKSGNIYGTTINGGTTDWGTIFEISPSGSSWKESVLYSFIGNDGDQQGPSSNLVIDGNGKLFGTTFWGGFENAGTVFELSPPSGSGDAWSETTIYRFDGTVGANPGGLILGRGGALYGTTLWGQTAYELRPPVVFGRSWSAKKLFEFNGGSGDGPLYQGGPMIPDKQGNLYGTTYLGGAYGEGEVFELSPPATGRGAWTESVLYSFGSYEDDGLVPTGAVVMDAAGNLFGTTEAGGANSLGGVFELRPPAAQGEQWTETLLHSFAGGSDGEAPFAGLVIDKAGNLYGVTELGGTGTCYSPDNTGCGTVFEVSPVGNGTWTASILHNFQGTSDGEFPYGGLMMNGLGHLLGTTSGGGEYGDGTVFEIYP